MDIPILYSDPDIIVVDKPSGLPTQPTVDKSRANLFDLLKLQLNTKKVFLHHRLDKDTSGVVILAVSERANKPLSEMFKNHSFTKIYNAICKAPPPNSSLDEKWEVKNHLVQRRLSSRSVKMFRTKSGGDFAHTKYRIIEKATEALLVEAVPVTGRTHQIRVHCLNSGIPILGDSLYGGKDVRVPRLMLHAQRIIFKHPFSQKEMQIESQTPKDFSSSWVNFKS